MTTISTADGDYLLNTSQHERQQPLPPLPVVTVSSVNELQAALAERDARIAFLERELVETRVQLAEKRASEDALRLELSRANLALSKANSCGESPGHVARVSASELSHVSAEDGEVLHRIEQRATAEPQRPRLVPPENREAHVDLQQPLRDAAEPAEGSTVRLPLGQHIVPPRSRRGSRKRNNVQGGDSWSNMNPGSCASGLDLLAGAIPRGASGMSMSLTLGSQGSINRMLGDIGLSSSDYSLKKRRSGDVAAGGGGHRRAHTSAAMGNYQMQRNEGWGDAGVAALNQGSSLFANANQLQGVGQGLSQGNAMFPNANRLAQGNMVLPNANRSQGNVQAGLQGIDGIFANAAAANNAAAGPQVNMNAVGPQANIFAELIRSSGPSPTLASTAEHPARRQDQGEDAANNNASSEEHHEE